MNIMTVLGPVGADELGTVFSHEHCFVDLRHQCREPEEISKKVLFYQRVCLENLSVVRMNSYAIRDNYLLSDLEVAKKELMELKIAGGRTIVDLTMRDIGRDPYLLKSLALATDINIIAGTGYYTYDTHPQDMDGRSVGKIADEMIRDLTIGIKNTGVKAGVIGELGTSKEIHPNEKKVLLAAAKAHHKTGAPIYVHIYPWTAKTNGVEVVNLLSDNKVRLDKVVICHTDVYIDMGYIRDVLSAGALVGFDNFGKQDYVIPENRTSWCGGIISTDRERVKALKVLIDEGFEQHILISNDVCRKTDLHHYGGWGYDHVLRNIVPMMIEEAIGKDTIDLLLKQNPKKLLDIT